MSRIGRSWISIATFAAALALIALPGPAAAKSLHTRQCKPEAHIGPATPPFYTPQAKLAAVKIWSGDVGSIHGLPWMSWTNAIGKSVQCTAVGNNPTKASCIATALPCRYVIHPTETHPPYLIPGIGRFGLRRPSRLHRPPRGFHRPHFGGSSVGRRLR